MEAQEIIDVLKENLSPVAEAAKEIGGVGWELLIKKHLWIDGVLPLVLFSILFSIFGVILFLCYRSEAKKDKPFKEESLQCIIIVITLMVSVIPMIPFFFTSGDMFGNVFIPEYYALMDILNGLK